MLARIYGIFRVQTPYFAPMNVIVMQNTSQFLDSSKQKYKFDLKGSMVGRKVKFNVLKVMKHVKDENRSIKSGEIGETIRATNGVSDANLSKQSRKASKLE